MSVSTFPYLIQIGDTVKTVQLIEEQSKNTIQLENGPSNTVLFQVVYPEELNLKPVHMKRGRPRKKKSTENNTVNEDKSKEPVIPSKTARTRSGRIIKTPKLLEKDFKKIEISDELEVKTTEFARITEEKSTESSFNHPGLAFHQRKRTVAAQHRCPKCGKAYLGKSKMIEHIKKYPDHGPLPEYTNYNFDVWNYLVDVTQKSPPSQRGVKFCEELTNLIHNVQLLASALFKSVTHNKNIVQIDKVLGNAISLPPGKYNFDENQLYKDVTVLQLITNSDFFNPNKPSKLDVEEKERIVNNQVSPHSNEVRCNSPLKNHQELPPIKKSSDQNIQSLLNENSLLNNLPNIRNSVDELMLTTDDTTSNLLDNSTSSDEVMNVDQFVNERFKKITEPDIELNGNTLNLVDLPSLDLFQFHTN